MPMDCGEWRFPMDVYSSQITNLVEQLSHLPGIGAKSAQRLAFHILNMTEEQVAGLSGAMMSAKKNVHYSNCYFLRCITAKNAVHIQMARSARSVQIRKEIIGRSWLWKIRETWQHTKRPANLTACIMYFMEQFLRWQELARMIFVYPS